jgi:hypothetical protein
MACIEPLGKYLKIAIQMLIALHPRQRQGGRSVNK